jgi:pSer/pThr/pTyr-binding forkhead associated (FHA) protein
MFDRVILRATEGELKGQEFVLNNETSYILGRSKDCSHHLPDTFYVVSRHHCRINVSAPFIRIQDLGSLNGTYVNGEKIGQRGKNQSFEEALLEEHAEHPLWDGDELRIGVHVFRVEFDPPPPCAEAEVRDQEKLWSGGCPACR